MLRKQRRGYSWRQTVLIGSAVLGFAILSQGCTAIGYTIGAYADSKTPELVQVPRSEWGQLKTGQKVKVWRMGSDMGGRHRFVSIAPSDVADDTVFATTTAPSGSTMVLQGPSIWLPYDASHQQSRGEAAKDTLRVRTDQIARLYRVQARRGRVYGALIGLAADIIFTLTVIAPEIEKGWFTGIAHQ